MFYLQYNGSYMPSIEMPNLKVPKVKRIDNPGKDDEFKIFFSFEGKDEETPRGQRLRDALAKLKKIDDKIFDLLSNAAKGAGGKAIFSPKGALDLTKLKENNYRSFVWVYESNGVTYPESFACKIQRDREDTTRFGTMRNMPLLCDRNNQRLDVTPDNIETVITRNSIVKPVIQPMSVYVAGNNQMITISFAFKHGRLVYQAPQEEYVLPTEDDEFAEFNDGVRGLSIKRAPSSSEDEDEEEEDDDEEDIDDEDAQLAATTK